MATRYHALQEAGSTKLHQLWFLKQRDAATEEARVAQAIAAATNALDHQAAIAKVQKWLGYANIATTRIMITARHGRR